MKRKERKERNKRVIYQVDTAIIEENIEKLSGGIKENPERYEFAIRLNELLVEKGIDQEKFAVKIGISTGSLSNYRKGTREPSLTTLVKMANELGVSVDYLAGKSDCPDYKLEKINEKTGLSEKAIKTLYKLQHDYELFDNDIKIDFTEERKISRNYKQQIDILNLILENGVNLFGLLENIRRYKQLYKEVENEKNVERKDKNTVIEIFTKENELKHCKYDVFEQMSYIMEQIVKKGGK